MDGLGTEISLDDCRWWCINNSTCGVIFTPNKTCEFKTDACWHNRYFVAYSGNIYRKFGN